LKAEEICNKLLALGDRQRALATQRFFKTGLGEYGEGDIFIGLTVPEVRKLAKEYHALPLSESKQLLQSSIHEARHYRNLPLYSAGRICADIAYCQTAAARDREAESANGRKISSEALQNDAPDNAAVCH
jgi:hypothetical protein